MSLFQMFAGDRLSAGPRYCAWPTASCSFQLAFDLRGARSRWWASPLQILALLQMPALLQMFALAVTDRSRSPTTHAAAAVPWMKPAALEVHSLCHLVT
eukprot:3299273-Prymnesium_polylepis.4